MGKYASTSGHIAGKFAATHSAGVNPSLLLIAPSHPPLTGLMFLVLLVFLLYPPLYLRVSVIGTGLPSIIIITITT